jgi:hypothetical protein
MKTSSLIQTGAQFCVITAAAITLSLLALGSSARADTAVYSNNDGSTGTFGAGITGTATGGFGQRTFAGPGALSRAG